MSQFETRSIIFLDIGFLAWSFDSFEGGFARPDLTFDGLSFPRPNEIKHLFTGIRTLVQSKNLKKRICTKDVVGGSQHPLITDDRQTTRESAETQQIPLQIQKV